MRRQFWFVTLLGVLALVLVGCSTGKKYSSNKRDPFAGKGSPYYKGSGPLPKGGGKYHVGSPYQVAGRWFTPKEQPNYDKTGTASWYGEAFHRRMTSNGEWFDMNDFTAAHPTLPLPSYAKVTNLENGREIVVRLNDRGPFVGTRIIDLSKRSSDALGFRRKGKAEVRVQWIGYAPLNDKGRHLAMMNDQMRSGAGIRQLARAARRHADDGPQVAAAEEAPPKRYKKNATYRQPQEEPQFANMGYVIYAAVFSKRENADAALEFAAQFGPVQLYESQGHDTVRYRLQIGPILDAAEAEQVLATIRKKGFPDARLKRVRIEQVAKRQVTVQKSAEAAQ